VREAPITSFISCGVWEAVMGQAMFTIIGAMAELESSLICERVTAGMKADRPELHCSTTPLLGDCHDNTDEHHLD
jgi:DNA invertase Pin-like site-specific DNA recombinase